MAVSKVSDADFEAEVLNATVRSWSNFWANGRPLPHDRARARRDFGVMGDKVKIVKLNVDESPNGSKYGVMSIPNPDIFKGGEMASRQVGAAPKQKLQQ